jgi:dynein heavy chain
VWGGELTRALLDDVRVQIPESAKIALFQEEKFKTYYNELHWALLEYDRVVTRVIPVTAMVLRPHFKDMEYKLRPGMITLTWTSMNIEAYIAHVRTGLQKLEELVNNINDIIENRVEKSLKIVSKTLLVDLPEGHSFTVEDFVKIQEKHITAQSQLLQVSGWVDGRTGQGSSFPPRGMEKVVRTSVCACRHS